MENARQLDLVDPKQFVEDLCQEYERVLPEGVEVFPEDRAAFAAFVMGIKPGLALNMNAKDLSGMEALAQAEGLDVISHENLIVDRDQLLDRFMREPEMARFFGFKNEPQFLDDFVGAASAITADAPGAQARAGFILGYPGTAVKTWHRSQTLEQKGLPTWTDLERAINNLPFLEYCDAGDKALLSRLNENALQLEAWNEQVAKMSPPMPYKQRFTETEKAKALFKRQMMPQVQALYDKHFDLDAASRDLLLNLKRINIFSPDGVPVFQFVTDGLSRQAEMDVLKLRGRVDQAFSGLN